MKAMLLRGPNMPFELIERPDPVAGPGEAVARVLTCGSGLTIQHAKAGRRHIPFPRIIGHEITGEIVEIGPGVTRLSVGDGVTAYFYLNCGHCRWCRANFEPLCTSGGGNVGLNCDGGYAEYIKLPAHIFIKLPEALDYKRHPAEIGVITDALATPYKVLRRARIKAGETVAVIGAGGGLGIHQVMMAKWARARLIAVEIAANKFDACRKAGADAVVDPRGDVVEALLDLTHGEGVDVVVDYVSNASTLEAGAKALGRHGRLVTLGGAGQPFQASAMEMLNKEMSKVGSGDSKNTLYCSFCGKSQHEVRKLIAGPTVFICDETYGRADGWVPHDQIQPTGQDWSFSIGIRPPMSFAPLTKMMLRSEYAES